MGLKIPYILEPGVTAGYVVEAKYVRGSFIVVEDIEEAQSLPKTALQDKTPIFIKDISKIYQYDEGKESFVPSKSALQDAPADGKVYARKDNKWYEILTVSDLSNYYTKQQADEKFVTKDFIESIRLINGGKANTIFS